MISKLITARLERIEQNAKQTLRDIEFIRGLCDGMETVADDYPPIPIPLLNQSNGFQEIVSEENNDERAKSQPLYRKEKRTDKTSSEEQT